MANSGPSDLGVEEERGPLHLLAHDEAERGEHGNSAVGDLHCGARDGDERTRRRCISREARRRIGIPHWQWLAVWNESEGHGQAFPEEEQIGR